VDVASWKWLKSVIEKLGWDGMSSEESEEEGATMTVYRPRILGWRRNIDKELKLIDDEYLRLSRTRPRRGPHSAPRRRNAGNKLSQRDPVSGLPVCLYDEKWMVQKTDRYVEETLKVSHENFRWVDIGVLRN
jgi:hypothetical protein